MKPILFCRDGTLRSEDSVYDRAAGRHISFFLPVHAIEDRRPGFFLTLVHSPVSFEQGLTVGEFFRNLAPFAREMTLLAVMDFPAFLAEATRPPAADAASDLDRIEIYARAALSAASAFEKADDPFERIAGTRLYRIGAQTPKITDRFELEVAWDYAAFYKVPEDDGMGGVADRCSVDYLPLDRWSHLPMTVARTMMFEDETPGSEHLSWKKGVVRSDLPGVRARGRGRCIYRRSLSLNAPVPLFFDIIRGFLWSVGFHCSPAGRDAFTEELLERAEDVEVDSALRRSADAAGTLDELERQIEAELADEEKRRAERHRAAPFNEEDLAKLAELAEIEERFPHLVRLPADTDLSALRVGNGGAARKEGRPDGEP